MSWPVVLGGVSAALLCAGIGGLIVKPTPRLAGRVRPYTIVARAGLGRSADVLGVANPVRPASGGVVRRLFWPPLHALAWDQVGMLYVLPVWRGRLEEYGALLGAATVVSLPALARDAPQLGSRIADNGRFGGADGARQAGLQLLTAALGVALAAQGWIVESQPGEPLALCSGPTRFDPVEVVNDMIEGRMDDATWTSWCQEAGLSHVALGAANAGPAYR